MMTPKKGGLQDKLNAAMERMNAGRVAKLKAKSEKAFEQGNVVKGIKLKAKEVKVGARGEKREAISLAKKGIKSMDTSKSMIPPAVDPMFQSNEMKSMKNDLNMYRSKNK